MVGGREKQGGSGLVVEPRRPRGTLTAVGASRPPVQSRGRPRPAFPLETCWPLSGKEAPVETSGLR